MRKAKVLFFAADPQSLGPERKPRLELDAEVREIRAKVRASKHRDALVFDCRLAARRDDLLQALNEIKPAIVHFSGHGWSDGLFLMDSRGLRSDRMDREHLEELFEVFRGQIRVVVLNACLSEPQAKAIADVVGCAIGMRREISDEAAIAFGAAFYRAIGFGHSVEAAFKQGRLAVPSAERECPQLLVRPGVDPGQIFVVRRAWSRKRTVALVGAVVAAATLAHDLWDEPFAACLRAGAPQALIAQHASSPVETSALESDLDRAKADYAAGRYAAAFPRFRRSAENGNPEAMGFVGAMFLRGQGTVARADSGIHWLREAAYDRDPKAMTALASAYQHGEGVRRNLGLARDWYHKAAGEKNWAEAMRKLGALYRSQQNHDAALTWYRNAAQAGSVDAGVDVAQSYETGQGTPRNLDAAVCLYSAAAKRGSPRGMLAMGRIYQNGIGVAQDNGRAARWYQRAARAQRAVN